MIDDHILRHVEENGRKLDHLLRHSHAQGNLLRRLAEKLGDNDAKLVEFTAALDKSANEIQTAVAANPLPK